jgi:16S rRNA U516 pseudouridylate synthase RsuA-like enzyme
VERLLANLGYGKRKECQQMVLKGRAVRKDGKKLKVQDSSSAWHCPYVLNPLAEDHPPI